MGYRGYGLPVSEIVSEGNVGLMQAVKRFDPDKGFRLATYAMWWIRASIQEYVLRSWSMVKMGTTAAQKKLFFNLRKAKTNIGAIEEGDLTPEHTATLADQLGVTEREVTEMNRRLSGRDASLNAPLRSESESEWQDWLADDTVDQETRLAEREELGDRHELLTSAMKDLTERERDIIQARRLQDEPATLEELSQKYGVSRERVRQIEVRAFEKLQRGMKSAMNHARALPAPGIASYATCSALPRPRTRALGSSSTTGERHEAEALAGRCVRQQGAGRQSRRHRAAGTLAGCRADAAHRGREQSRRNRLLREDRRRAPTTCAGSRPTREVDLCGHATLASAWIMFNNLDTALNEVRFQTRSGELVVTRGERRQCDVAALRRSPSPSRRRPALPSARRRRWARRRPRNCIISAIGRRGTTKALDRGVGHARADQRADAGRDLEHLWRCRSAPRRATSPGDGKPYDFVSRFFAPYYGVPEDPVTGSAHCALTPFWAKRLGKKTLKARQAIAARRRSSLHR